MARMESFNKHLYRPNTYLHKWWARRCGSTFRLILKHLVLDPDLTDYYSAGGLEGQIILDPMMGGGTTLHEAIRLGANVIGMDIDPIPVLQAKATLSKVSADELEKEFDIFFDALSDRMNPYFETACPSCQKHVPMQYMLYGLRKKCSCREFIAIDSYTLRHEADGSILEICPHCMKIVKKENGNSHECSCMGKQKQLIEKKQRLCSDCGEFFKEITEIPFYERYVPLVVVGNCLCNGLFFKRVDKLDLSAIKEANNIREKLGFTIGDFDIMKGPKSSDLIRRNISSYLDVFSSRQLIYLYNSLELLKNCPSHIRLYFSLLVSTSLEFNSLLCGYKGADKRRPGAVRHTFSHHAYSFPTTALENNPTYYKKTSGTLQSLFYSRVIKARQWAENPREKDLRRSEKIGGNSEVEKEQSVKISCDTVVIDGETDYGIEVENSSDLQCGNKKYLLVQGSSIKIPLSDSSVDHIVTDPPYFDSVQYSDLAAFFRVWLKQLLPEFAVWDYSLLDSAVNPEDVSNDQYQKVLSGIFIECYRVLRKPSGKLIFTFHHWKSQGWTALTIALKRAGFILLDKYVVHSENPISVHISNLKSLKHDAVLIFGAVQDDAEKRWLVPEVVMTNDSETFCSNCAEVLGWCLAERLTEEEISDLWDSLLK